MTDVKGVGVDLAQIPRMRRVVERWDERFLRRVFTDDEIAYCRRRRDPIPHLAARFAAKEATLKALGTGLRMGVNWRELEVRRERGQAPTMVLTGRTMAIARARGGSRVLLSLSHDGDYAMAQALLVGDSRDTRRGAAVRDERRPLADARRGPSQVRDERRPLADARRGPSQVPFRTSPQGGLRGRSPRSKRKAGQ